MIFTTIDGGHFVINDIDYLCLPCDDHSLLDYFCLLFRGYSFQDELGYFTKCSFWDYIYVHISVCV